METTENIEKAPYNVFFIADLHMRSQKHITSFKKKN